MTPTEFRAARQRLGLSVAALARALDLSESQVYKLQSGRSPVSGPARKLITHWLDHPECAPEKSRGRWPKD